MPFVIKICGEIPSYINNLNKFYILQGLLLSEKFIQGISKSLRNISLIHRFDSLKKY